MTKKMKYYWIYRRCSEDDIEVAINMIFHKYGIKIEAYHRGQINGVCVRRLMADSEDIIHELFILLKGYSRGYVTDEKSEQVCRTHAKLLHQIYGVVSCLRKFDPTYESIIEKGYFVADSMKTWRKPGLSVTQKEHIFEDHAIDSMQDLNGVGDMTEDCIELSHQYGARQDRHRQGLRDYNQNNESQHKADNSSSHPKVQEAK